MTALDAEVLVVGGGVAGLAAARELAARGREVRLVEAGPRVGGVAATDAIRGYRVESGPNAFRARAACARWLTARGLAAHLVRAGPESATRFLWRDGRLERLPGGPLELAATRLLTWRGKLRLLGEPFAARGDAAGESVADFVSRRLGREVLERFVAPFLTGVYAGDEARLGAEAVFPALVAYERERGSIALGAAAAALRSRGGPRGWSGSWSAREGLGELAQALAEGLPAPPELATRAVAVEREGDVWRADLRGPQGERSLRARALVLATPAGEAAELLRDVDAEASQLASEVESAPIAAVALGVRRSELARPLRGFGFLVPSGESLRLLGCLFMSRVFPGRAPEDCELLHCMLGGVRRPELIEAPDEELERIAAEDLDRALGLRGGPERLAVRRWPRAVPQPDARHPARVAALRSRLRAHPGLLLAGGYLDGVALGDALVSGAAAGSSAAETLAH